VDLVPVALVAVAVSLMAFSRKNKTAWVVSGPIDKLRSY